VSNAFNATHISTASTDTFLCLTAFMTDMKTGSWITTSTKNLFYLLLK
jgi:hypothetical protein